MRLSPWDHIIIPQSWPKTWLALPSAAALLDIVSRLQAFDHGAWLPLALDLYEITAESRGVKPEVMELTAGLRRLAPGHLPSSSTWRRLTTKVNKAAKTWHARFGTDNHNFMYYGFEKLKVSVQRNDYRYVVDFMNYINNYVLGPWHPKLCEAVRTRIPRPKTTGFTA